VPRARQVTSRSAGLKAGRARRQADYHLQGDDSWSMSGKKILLLPTVVINGNQYRGRLEVPAITRALCAGFSETSEPSVHCRLMCQAGSGAPCGRRSGPSAHAHVAHPEYTSQALIMYVKLPKLHV